jgi:hypothetical protein
VNVDPLAVIIEGEEIGARTARTRFPQVSDGQKQVMSNSPVNLQAGEAMRNVGVGNWKPAPHEEASFREVVRCLKEQVFSEAAIKKALLGFESVLPTLPKKLGQKDRERAYQDILNQANEEGCEFRYLCKAFVKAEISGKGKPRTVSDHGIMRLLPLAKVAYVFEKIVGDLKFSNIKGRAKMEALKELFSNFAGMKNGGQLIENDLTAFEYGVSQPLKEAEQEILRHIGGFLNLHDVGEWAFERVVDERNKKVTWVMKFKDAAGAKQTLKITLPTVIRDSGDRITSSGNWLQNVFAWFSMLASAESVEDGITRWARSSGKNFFYKSSRDGGRYLARLGFEGDDTAGGLEEPIAIATMEEFFRRWGWKPKIRVVSPTGDDYLEFVGMRALMENGKPVFGSDHELIAAPPIKRFFKEKSWMTAVMEDGEYHGTLARYAMQIAEHFRNVAPMYRFAQAMFNDHIAHDCNRVSESFKRDYFFTTGVDHVDGDKLRLVPFEGSDERVWRRWTEASAGVATECEWASMCGLMSLKLHGLDLRVYLPRAWLTED